MFWFYLIDPSEAVTREDVDLVSYGLGSRPIFTSIAFFFASRLHRLHHCNTTYHLHEERRLQPSLPPSHLALEDEDGIRGGLHLGTDRLFAPPPLTPARPHAQFGVT